MRILFLCLGIYRPEGGMERFNQRVVRVLSEMVQNKKIERVSVISLWDDTQNNPVLPGICFTGNASNKLATTIYFLQKILSERPDIILYGHILFSPLALIGRIIHPKGKSILFVHGTEVWENPFFLNMWFCDKGFTNFITVSKHTAKKLMDTYKISSSRIFIHLNAIDDKPLRGEEHQKNELAGHYNLISICRLSTNGLHKNIDRIIEAMPKILTHFPGTHYYIIGDGDWRGELVEMCSRLGLNPFVHFLGWLNDKEKDRYLKASDIFILPSVGEGFGIVFLEAWQNRLPIITSNQGAAPEIVEHNRGGLCVEPNPDAITKAVFLLLSDYELRRSMGNFGYEKLQNNYLHEHFCNRLTEYLLRP